MPLKSNSIASCFNRLLLTTEEGGAQPKDYEARYLGDRVRAIGTTWLGLTIGCSQCHDHKFDPLTMQDFYSMGAFFADIDEASSASEKKVCSRQPCTSHTNCNCSKLLCTPASRIRCTDPQLAEQQREWERQQLAIEAAGKSWQPLAFSDIKAEKGSTLTAQADQSILASGERPDQENYLLTWQPAVDAAAAPTKIAALQLEVLPHESLPAGGSGRAGNGNFVLTEIVARVLRPLDNLSRSSSLLLEHRSNRLKLLTNIPTRNGRLPRPSTTMLARPNWGWAILPDVKNRNSCSSNWLTPLN